MITSIVRISDIFQSSTHLMHISTWEVNPSLLFSLYTFKILNWPLNTLICFFRFFFLCFRMSSLFDIFWQHYYRTLHCWFCFLMKYRWITDVLRDNGFWCNLQLFALLKNNIVICCFNISHSLHLFLLKWGSNLTLTPHGYSSLLVYA